MKIEAIDQQPMFRVPQEGERDRPGRPVASPAQPLSQLSPLNLQPGHNPADTALVSRTEFAATSTAANPADAPASQTQTPDRGFDFATHPIIHSSNHPVRTGRPRNGKIARLPKPVRDLVNRMLFNHIPQEHIVEALSEIGINVTQRNISNWKTRGGYREWYLAQEHAIQLHNHQDNLVDLIRRHDANELPEVGLQAAATQLSQFFLTPEARQLLASDPKEYERRVAMLSRISAQLQQLQKYRDDSARNMGYKHDPARVRRDTTRELDKLRQDWSSKPGASAKDPDSPHRNELPNPREVFHLVPPDPSRLTPTLEEFVEVLRRREAKAAAKAQPSEPPVSPAAAPSSPQVAAADKNDH